MTIEVSGGGSVAVETESMLSAQRELRELAARAGAIHEQVAGALGAAALAISGAVWALGLAQRELAGAGRDAETLAWELEAAAEAYGWAERAVGAQQLLAARLAGPVPELLDVFLAVGISAVQHEAVGFSDARFVTALRGLADSLNLPALLLPVQALPGAALEETPVTVIPVPASAQRTAPPAGFADLARRIPEAKAGQPQVRVEKYELPGGENHWVVYSAGTIDWSLVPGTEPWDDTSNVVGLAGGSAGSTRAAMLALKRAGWRPGEPVVPVGHSQGGIVAGAIATSGVAPAPLLVTFGSPAPRVSAPAGTIDVAVEHTDDLVPALGGGPRPLTDSRLLVREAAPGVKPSDPGVPAHHLSSYEQTATEMDASTDPRLVRARTTLADFTGGQKAEVTLWRGERVSGARPATSGGGR
ncbi:hypothetical protein GCM10022286_21080 [Gryllotalpicola daejeonensis]|uniref:Alpha/beta hydrolase n=1 Tax=Gryllotalpicola daejeonensis TaxID=993087 RepID=A0ABP7ZKZ4_9MICO